MNTNPSSPSNRVGISDRPVIKKAEPQTEVIRDILKTREIRQLLKAILPEALNLWAGSSVWKKWVSRVTGRNISKRLSRPIDVPAQNEIAMLLEDERFVRNLGELLPGAIDGLLGALCAAGCAVERLPTEDTKGLIGDLITAAGKGRMGTLLSAGARILNDIHQTDPEFFARTLEPGFQHWVEKTDFGELKEAVENSASDLRATVEMANTVIWQYPAKVVLLLSLIPSALNMTTDALGISAEKLNTVPPDMLTDILLAFLREIDSRSVAKLVNELTEIARKFQTGSALLGEPGSPLFPKQLTEKLEEVIDRIDAVTFWKGHLAAAEIKSRCRLAMAEAANKKPDLFKLGLIKGPEISNIRFRSANQKLAHWEDMTDDEQANLLARHLDAYDIQEAVDVFNTMIRLTNRLWEQRPEVCIRLVGQVVSAIDHDELADATTHLFENARDELKPVARTVVPGLIQGICDALRPEDDEHEDEAAAAREALRSLLLTQEV